MGKCPNGHPEKKHRVRNNTENRYIYNARITRAFFLHFPAEDNEGTGAESASNHFIQTT